VQRLGDRLRDDVDRADSIGDDLPMLHARFRNGLRETDRGIEE
jgi:hypothetical protein